MCGSSWCVCAYLLSPSSPADRTAQVCRVAAINGAAFEWIHHAHVALDEGLSPAQLAVVRDTESPLPSPNSPAPLSAFHAAALAYTDAMTRDISVPESLVEGLKAHLKDDQQLLEATATIATYNMVSRLLVALDVGEFAAERPPLAEGKEKVEDIKVAEGVTIHVRAVEKEGAPWIVLVNSLMTDHTMWDRVVPALARKYSILQYDQRGHGRSSVPLQSCTLSSLAADIPALLSHLGIATPVHAVIGVSQGGATTLALAQGHRGIASRFIVCDTQATSPAANSGAWDQRIALAHEKGMATLADATVPRWFPPASACAPGGRLSPPVHAMITRTKVEGFEKGARALQGYDVRPGLEKALEGVPVLFLAGDQDGALPGVLEKLAKELGKEFVAVPGAGHLPMLDRPGAWIAAVETFLEL